MRVKSLLIVVLSVTLVRAQAHVVNGNFEDPTGLGWTQWQAPWSEGVLVDPAGAVDPYEGAASLSLQAAKGSFGVYQEFCVDAGVPFLVEWAWRGRTADNGWFEVLLIDAPYSYGAADDPANHPETHLAAKWESGFGGALPEPSETWITEAFEFTPETDTVTIVLKCGSTEGDLVEAGFDEVIVTHDHDFVEVFSIDPPMGSVAGGDLVRVLGQNLTSDAEITFDSDALVSPLRLGTCEMAGETPPHAAGPVDVTVTTAVGTFTLPKGFTYVQDKPRFVRGNCDGIDPVNLTDAIALLGYLYLGTAEPPCLEACNSDDDASLGISDAIVVLNFLFLGSAPPPAPYPDCGPDPTPSESCETPHDGC